MADSKKTNQNDNGKMQKLQADLDKMKKVAKKLLQQKNQYESQIKKLKEDSKSSQESINELQSQLKQSHTIQAQLEEAIEKKNSTIHSLEHISEKDAERAKALKLKMNEMVFMFVLVSMMTYDTM